MSIARHYYKQECLRVSRTNQDKSISWRLDSFAMDHPQCNFLVYRYVPFIVMYAAFQNYVCVFCGSHFLNCLVALPEVDGFNEFRMQWNLQIYCLIFSAFSLNFLLNIDCFQESVQEMSPKLMERKLRRLGLTPMPLNEKWV